MAVNGETFKNKEHRHWPLFLILLAFCGLSCPALLITTPWQRSQAQGRFVPVSLHSDQTADYTRNPNPPLFPAVRMDIVWDAILDRDPSAAQTLAQRQAELQASLDEEIKVSSSVCQGQYLVPAAFDTWVDSANPGRANPGRANPGNAAGDDTILQLGRADNDLKRVLLYFPVEEMLPGGPFIYRARLELRLTDPAASKPEAVHIFNLKQPFAEMTTTWLNQPGSHIDTLPPTHSAANVHTWDVTEFVRSWLLGHYANHGIMLELPPGLNLDLRYYSREADTRMNFDVSASSLVPRLVIDCSPAPEPTAVAAQPTPVPGPPTSGDEDIPPAANATQTPPAALPATPTPFLPTATPPATLLPTPTEWPVLPTPTAVLPAPTLLPTDTPIALPTDTPVPPTSQPATSTPVPATATSTPIPPTATFTPVPPQADVRITKSDSPDPVLSGSVLTYNLSVTNNGPDQATGVSVADSLPAGVTLISTTASQGTCTGTTCNLGALASGGSASITIRVTVNAASGTLNNTAQVSANETDPNPGNNSASTGTTITAPAADMAISKLDSPDPVDPGANLTYTLGVSNNGPNNATGVTVVDTLPAGVTLVSATSTSGACSGSTTITCNLGNIANGSTESVTIIVTVGAGASGTLHNQAAVSADQTDPILGNNNTVANTTIEPPAVDVSISKTGAPNPVAPGSQLTYNLTVANSGPGLATGVTVVDTLLSANISFLSVTPSQGSCAVGSTVTCNLGSIAGGGSATITIVTNVGAGASGTLVNQATVSSNELDTNTGNNTATESTPVSAPLADLVLNKSAAPDPVDPGDNLTYTLGVSNNGPNNATGVTVVDTLPAGVTLMSATSTSGACSGSTIITCNLGDIASGTAESVTIIVTVGGASGTLHNQASVSADQSDPNTGNNSDTVITTVNTGAAEVDLSISKTGTPDPASVGSDLTYTLTIVNNSAADATGVTVVDTLPATGISFISASAGCAENTGTVTCAIGNLAAGSSVQRTIVIRPNASMDFVTNQATVSGDQPDPNTANNVTTITTTITSPGADLQLTKTVDNSMPIEGDTIGYTVVVANNGSLDPAANVRVNDLLPAGVSYVDHSGVGSYNHSSGVWNLGTPLNIGSPATLLITATVDTGTTGTIITNTATATAAQSDPNPGNNTAAAVITVMPTLSIGNVSVSEGDAGTTAAVFNVTLSSAVPQNVYVNYATADGTATLADNDYVTASGVLTFAAGTTNQAITVQVQGDTTAEPDEMFFVNLSTPVNAVLADGQGVGSIQNDDGAGPITAIFLPPSDDTWLQQDAPHELHGNHKDIRTNPDPMAEYRAVVEFDLAPLPLGSTILTATLYLYEDDERNGQTIYLHPLTTGWGEGNTTWNTPWVSPGGDFGAAVASFPANLRDQYRAIDVTGITQQWWAGTPNHGLLLLATGPNGTVKFPSKESSDPGKHPQLYVAYQPGGSPLIATGDSGPFIYLPVILK